MPVIKIGDRLVGDGQPTYIIAEIGVNHNGILPLALELIDAAVGAGADAVKFQKRNLDKLYAKKYLDNANSGEKTLRYLLPILQRVELTDDDFHQIVDYCKKKHITFLCSAFDPQSAGVEVALFDCNSKDPGGFEDINFRFMDQLWQFGVPVGYSGHERGIA